MQTGASTTQSMDVDFAAVCKKILAKCVAYDPHTYILDGICPALDWFDLLATTPTVSGNTGY